MHDYLIQFLPSPQAVKVGATIVLVCAIAAMPKPAKEEGGYYWFWAFVNSLPIPSVAHLKK